MGALFGVGSLCFAIAPVSAYTQAVGARGDALTYFGGSVLFTLGGLTQTVLAAPDRKEGLDGLSTWRAAWVQSIGTLLFNVMTFAAITIEPGDSGYDRIVWAADALGSVCFLISGVLLFRSSPRRGLLPKRHHKGWWEPAVNLLGCILFGISAAGAFGLHDPPQLLSAVAANWTTALGALCFLICGAAACGLMQTLKSPRLRTLRAIEHEVEDLVEHV